MTGGGATLWDKKGSAPIPATVTLFSVAVVTENAENRVPCGISSGWLSARANVFCFYLLWRALAEPVGCLLIYTYMYFPFGSFMGLCSIGDGEKGNLRLCRSNVYNPGTGWPKDPRALELSQRRSSEEESSWSRSKLIKLELFICETVVVRVIHRKTFTGELNFTADPLAVRSQSTEAR